jgi:hypothetical protein
MAFHSSRSVYMRHRSSYGSDKRTNIHLKHENTRRKCPLLPHWREEFWAGEKERSETCFVEVLVRRQYKWVNDGLCQRVAGCKISSRGPFSSSLQAPQKNFPAKGQARPRAHCVFQARPSGALGLLLSRPCYLLHGLRSTTRQHSCLEC